ncbi:MAG: hypothetical protein IJ428_01520 [Clostridia bacterium]|nr:hypothetical protein [Clostridia bacterium]
MIEAYTPQKDGFDVLFGSEGWQIAAITYAEQYSAENHQKLSRHMTTDEVFVLVRGEACLYTTEDGKALEAIPMEHGKVYCVKKATWHSLAISRDAFLAVAENAALRPEDTERMTV